MNPSWLIHHLVLLPEALLVWWSVRLVRRATASTAWPLVAATILESRAVDQGKGGSPRVKFEYQVDARRHVGRRLWVVPALFASSISVSGDWAHRVVARYPVGASVRVAVDPADASYAVLEPGRRAMHWLPLAIGVMGLAANLVAAVGLPAR